MAGCICCSSTVMLSSAEIPSQALSIIASVTKVSVFKDTIGVGETAQLELEWSTGAKQELFYSSSDESVATVDQNGLITGISDGTAVITVSHSDVAVGKDQTITITVSNDVEKSTVYNTSELTLGTKLHKYDTLHYDQKNIGNCANIVNTNGDYDLAFIGENDYVLPFDAELVGIDGLVIYLAPDIDGINYLDGRTLNVGDKIDTSTHLLCYDYCINNRILPVFLPKYYEKYIGSGEITVKEIDHESKTITLESTESTIQYGIGISQAPEKTDYQIGEELDLSGLRLNGSYTETIDGEELVGCIMDESYQELLERNVPITIDSSEFDNTQAGTYHIYVIYGNAKDSFTVTVSNEKFEEETFFVVVGTYYGEYIQLRYFYPSPKVSGKFAADKVVWKKSFSDYNYAYGDILIAENDVSLTQIYDAPDNPAYAMSSYFELDGTQELTKIGNCADLMDGKNLTVIDRTYDGSAHYSVRLSDENNVEYRYGLNSFSSVLGIDVLDSEIGDVYTFAFYHDNIIVPLSKQENTTIQGDVSGDGTFGVSDVILFQKWLLGVHDTHLTNWKAADFYADNKLNVFDLCLMKKALIEK